MVEVIHSILMERAQEYMLQHTKFWIGTRTAITQILLFLSLLLSSSISYSQLSSDSGSVIRPATLYAGVQNPNSGCGCDSADVANPCSGTTVDQRISGTQFVWTFSCSGGNCQCGRYVNGDFWVKHPTTGDVVISAVTPAGNENGLVLDPTDSILNSTGGVGSQGYFGNVNGYTSSLNNMSNLPLSVSSGKTLVKGAQTTRVSGYPSACGTHNALAYSILNVVSAVPNDGANGRNTFRPPFVSGAKPTFTVSDFTFSRLPARTDITVTQADLDVMSRWWKPYPDVDGGDFGRCFVPSGYYPDNYAAGLSQTTIEDILKLTGNIAALNSTNAKYAMIQRGLDLYYAWQAGRKWDCGAGQCLGRKEPIIYMAALSNNSTIRTNVAASAALETSFQEDNQITSSNTPNVIIWGGAPGNSVWDYTYWQKVFDSKCYDGANPTVNCKDTLGNRAIGDPYRYIDGPAHTPGSIYLPISAGAHIGHATLMLGWKDYCEIANDHQTISWSDKFYYPSSTTASGQVLNTDPCAPPDSREPSACTPYPQFPNPSGTGCLYYGGRTGATDANSTWGPLPSNPSQCVPNNSNGNTGQTGRFSWLHGKKFMSISTTTAGSIGYNVDPLYISTIAKNQYATIRTATPKCSNGVWTP